MFYTGDSGVEKAVTEIWYSILLSEETYKLLCTSLKELINISSAHNLQLKTGGLIGVDDMQLKQLQDVWKSWLALRVQGTNWIQKQREKQFKSNFEYVARNDAYIQNVPVQHANALKKWTEDGVFKRSQTQTCAENPTLTGVERTARYGPYSYQVHPGIVPFAGWDYLQVKKFKSSSCLITMYGEYIECILRNFMERLSKQQVSFQIALCDCMDIKRHLEEDTVYDRILTSNLMDYVLLPNLLDLCSQMLNHDNHRATIITETILWTVDIMPAADVNFPSKILQIPRLLKIALEDTKRTSFADDGGISVIEYLDNSLEFFSYLRAMFYVNCLKDGKDGAGIPVIKELGNEFQLQLRDGIRNENRIVFFRPAVNRRRVTIVTGRERFLEWIPMQKK